MNNNNNVNSSSTASDELKDGYDFQPMKTSTNEGEHINLRWI